MSDIRESGRGPEMKISKIRKQSSADIGIFEHNSKKTYLS